VVFHRLAFHQFVLVVVAKRQWVFGIGASYLILAMLVNAGMGQLLKNGSWFVDSWKNSRRLRSAGVAMANPSELVFIVQNTRQFSKGGSGG